MCDRTYFKENYRPECKRDRDNYADLIYQYLRWGPERALHQRDHFNIIGTLHNRPSPFSNETEEGRCQRIRSCAKWHRDVFCEYKIATDLHHYTILSLEAFFHQEEIKGTWTS